MPEGGSLGSVVDVGSVLAPEREALVQLLSELDDDEWGAPTPCPAWSVHELAVHLIHDDLRRLAGDRDGHAAVWVEVSGLDELVVALDRVNERWVETMAPTLSPRLIRELLGWSAAPTEEHLLGLDPFVRGVPAALPPPGTSTPVLVVHLTGRFERGWTLQGGPSGWAFTTGVSEASARVEIPVDAFWRRAVRMLDRDQIERAARCDGDDALVDAVLDLRAAIVPDLPST
jgi:hypothetical protein